MSVNAQRKTNEKRDQKIAQALELETYYQERGMTYFVRMLRSARHRIELAKTEDNLVILDKERAKRRP